MFCPCSAHVLPMFCTCSFHGDCITNSLSYCGLVDTRISASEKDLLVLLSNMNIVEEISRENAILKKYLRMLPKK